MPRTTEEQAEQVARYAEILAAQNTDREAFRIFALEASLASLASSGAVIAIAVSFFVNDGQSFVVAAAVVASSMLTAAMTFLLLRRAQARQRSVAERLVSLLVPSSVDVRALRAALDIRQSSTPTFAGRAEPGQADPVGSTSIRPDQG